jgi:hypothetical protein
MKIPPKVKIRRLAGKTIWYKVVYQETIRDDPTCMGNCDPNERIIYLKIGMSKTDTLKTFMHEIFHAIEFEYQTPMPHRITDVLEEGVFKILKMNKWL